MESTPTSTTTVDGYIATTTKDGVTTYAWNGGDTIIVSNALIDNPAPGVFTLVTKPERVGDRFTIGPYSLEVVEVRVGMLLARRMYW